MKNHKIGLLGGGLEQAALANDLAGSGSWEVYAMFLEGPLLVPEVHCARDFRDVLWLCGTLVLPPVVCREGLILDTPLWSGPPVDAGQFLGLIGKGVLLFGGEQTPEFARAAAAREVAVISLPRGKRAEDWPPAVMGYLARTEARRVGPRPKRG